MMNMSKEMTNLRQSAGMVAALIGKEVSWVETTDQGVIDHSGTVSAVLWKDNVQYARVGNQDVAVDQILSIAEPPANSQTGVPAVE
jgi:flagellar basal-body rod modification protein FlgD